MAGNFTVEEAAGLCEQLGIGWMIGHHFGMFESNTVDVTDIRKKLNTLKPKAQCCLLDPGEAYYIITTRQSTS